MSRIIDTKEYLDAVVSLLQEGQTNLPVTVSGVSMTPFLHPGDTVYLNLPQRNFRPGDIVLFTRPDGRYILHRIIKRRTDCFVLLGDAQQFREYVPESAIYAIVTSVRIGDRHMSLLHPYCLFFRTIWMWFAPLRPQMGAIAGFLLRHKKSR